MFEHPVYQSDGFNCLYCKAYAKQTWLTLSYAPSVPDDALAIRILNKKVEASICSKCSSATFWLDKKNIFPPTGIASPANSDLPDDVKEVYKEANAIAGRSPRAACALLRLAVEMLLKHLGETGPINGMIKILVAKGLDDRVQQALDIVRVTGNNAVHPGAIDFDDSTNDVQALFGLINFIADDLITRPKQIGEMFDNLPEEAREAIEKRDGKTF